MTDQQKLSKLKIQKRKIKLNGELVICGKKSSNITE